MGSNEKEEMVDKEIEQINQLGSDITKSEKGNIYTLTIIGQVEGHQIAPENMSMFCPYFPALRKVMISTVYCCC